MFRSLSLATVILVMSASAAFAQVEQPSQITIQALGLVTKSSNDQTPAHEATKSGGFLVGYSYQFSRWFGAEGNYGFTRNTQKYGTLGGPTLLESDFHEVTGALVVHIPARVSSFRPYVLGGGGALIFDPTNRYSVGGVDRQTRGTVVYGGGANFDLTNKLGVRVEYRGLVYKVPDFSISTLNLDKYTHLAQPSAGIFFRF
jgi:opacity protein-like surface antigen